METDETTTIKYDKPEDNAENAFNRYVRLKLTDYILKGPERLGGCDLEISKLIHKKRIETFYPLHERSITQQLASNILKASVFPWTFPFDDYRGYFGEKLSLFMVFLGHYSKWLIYPSIVGIIFQFVVWVSFLLCRLCISVLFHRDVLLTILFCLFMTMIFSCCPSCCFYY
jgi:hypothetical protein